MNFIVSFLASFLLFFQTNLESIRTSYAKANSSATNTQNFITIAEKETDSDPVILGYKAAAQIMQAKITKQNRKSLVKTGATNLERLIKSNPNILELRVIRLSIQENLPKIVGYRGNLKEDKNFIFNNYAQQNTSLKNYIKQFVMQSKTISASEKATLK
ncbi:hypothetical protein [Chryseobacterium potabilaquae]|uniref:Uncharacterized protein n=1 Tax=Chryseobacterium potabilaquae TaxID=2675057 RepID=A0A6N4XAB2_9FLAO|nr:hypothetical protein [Chryseobacterium potabilaquae]CAA7195345.1 hypothetical protein CHRY9293_01559 [Chryseobacterium potabilaquae]